MESGPEARREDEYSEKVEAERWLRNDFLVENIIPNRLVAGIATFLQWQSPFQPPTSTYLSAS
jgi:hypothetical protein